MADNRDQGCRDSPVAILCSRQGSRDRAVLFCQAGCDAGPGAREAGTALKTKPRDVQYVRTVEPNSVRRCSHDSPLPAERTPMPLSRSDGLATS